MKRTCRLSFRLFALAFPLLAAGCGGSSDPPAPPAGDATLSSLAIQGVELESAFQPDLTAYSASVGFLTASVDIVAEATAPEASIKIGGTTVDAGATIPVALAEGANSIQVEVTNGSGQQNYTIEIARGSMASFAERAHLKADPPRRDAVLGTSLGASGDAFIAGTPYEDVNAQGVDSTPSAGSLPDSGAAYIFARDASGNWAKQAYLKASNAGAGDTFGSSAAISGDIAVVGAPYESSDASGIDGDGANDARLYSGAAYVFVRDSSGHWTQEAYLKASDPVAHDYFGYSVAVSGDTVVVGSRTVTDGAVYVFRRDTNGTWAQEAALAPWDASYDVAFAHFMALDGDTLAVSAKWHPSGSFAGAVYVYRRSASGEWSEDGLLKGSNTDPDDSFGSSVALSGDRIAVGAIGESSAAMGIGGDESDDSAPQSGAAYVFRRTGAGAWEQEAYVKASNTGREDDFGFSVALQGDWLAVGAENEGSNATGVGGDQANDDTPGSGAVYLYRRDGSGLWSQQLYIKASNAGGNHRFGRDVAFTASGLVVAAPFEGNTIDATSLRSGAAYVFE